MKYLLKTLVILIACATLASWLKMGIPGLSIGYWKLWLEDSIRHKIGIIIGVPLFELLAVVQNEVIQIF